MARIRAGRRLANSIAVAGFPQLGAASQPNHDRANRVRAGSDLHACLTAPRPASAVDVTTGQLVYLDARPKALSNHALGNDTHKALRAFRPDHDENILIFEKADYVGLQLFSGGFFRVRKLRRISRENEPATRDVWLDIELENRF